MTDVHRLFQGFTPVADGESPMRHRTGIVTVVNANGTVDLTLGGTTVAGVSVLAGAQLTVGSAVQVTGWAGDLLVLGAVATSNEELSPDMVLLSETVAAGDSANIISGTLPQTHKDLLVLYNGNHEGGGTFRTWLMRFNGISANEYRWVATRTFPSTAPANVGSTAAVSGIVLGEQGGSDNLNASRVFIPNYSTAVLHPVTFEHYGVNGTGGTSHQVSNGAGAWVPGVAAAITTVTMNNTTDQIASGSTMRVYGIGPV